MNTAAHAQLVNALCQAIRDGNPTAARLQAVERATRPTTPRPASGGSRAL